MSEWQKTLIWITIVVMMGAMCIVSAIFQDKKNEKIRKLEEELENAERKVLELEERIVGVSIRMETIESFAESCYILLMAAEMKVTPEEIKSVVEKIHQSFSSD